MSYNARSVSFAVRSSRAAAAAAGEGFDFSDLDEVMEEARREAAFIKGSDYRRFVSPQGLQSLWEREVPALEELLEKRLPDYARTQSGGYPGDWGRDFGWLHFHEADRAVQQAAREGGWLRAVATGKYPFLLRLLKKTQHRGYFGGMGKRTTLCLPAFIEAFPSPGNAERRLRAVRRRAQAILSAYAGGRQPSWGNLAKAMIARKEIGKAAIIAVAMDLKGEEYTLTYRLARQFLIDYHLCKVEDTSDGVVAQREAEPRLEKLGVAVYRIALPKLTRRNRRRIGTDFQWLVKRAADGRTYHSNWGGTDEAVRRAIQAWRTQDEAARVEADFIPFLNGELGFTPLVVREDSYAAGNCEIGTDCWVAGQGWHKRRFIPASWLVPHLDYKLVKNVATRLYQKHVREQQQRKAA